MHRAAPLLIAVLVLAVLALAGTGLARLQWPQGLPTWGPALKHYLGLLLSGAVVASFVGWRLRCSAWAATFLVAAALVVVTGNALALAAAILVPAACAVVGRWFLSVLRAGRLQDDGVAQLLAGAGLYGTLVSVLARWPVHHVWTYLPALLLPVLLGWRQLREAQAKLLHAAREQRQAGWGAAAVDALIGGIAIVYVAVALLPELGQDALAVHLFVGNQLATRHSWAFDVEKYVWAVMPMLADWVFALAYMVGGEGAARLLNIGFIVVVALLLRDLVRWCGGGAWAQRWAVLVFASMPLTFTLGSSLFIESVWTAFVLAGTLSLLPLVTAQRERADFVRAGLFLGFALAAKAVTLIILPVLACVLLLRPRHWWPVRSQILLAGAVLVLAGCIPYVNAWIKTGNPVFPFFNAVFRSPYYPPENFESASSFSRGLRWDFPYQVSFDSIRFIEGLNGAGGFQWLLLMLPAGLALVLAWRRRALLLMSVALLSMALAFASVAYLRYVFPAFVIACAAAGIALADERWGRWPRLVLTIAAGTAVALNLLFLGAGSPYRDFAIPSVADRATRDAWLEVRMPLRRAITVTNELNSGGAPVAVLGPPVLGQLASDALLPNWYNSAFYNLIKTQKSAAAMVDALQEVGVEYVLVDPDWPQPVKPLQLVVEGTEAIAMFGPVTVRRWKPEFRFRHELLANPRFEDGGGWQLTGGGVRVAGGMTVNVSAPAFQTVPVQSGRRYLNSITVSCPEPTQARAQVNWSNANGRFLKADIRVVECAAEPSTHEIEVVAPTKAGTATVYASAHGSGSVNFLQNSFRR